MTKREIIEDFINQFRAAGPAIETCFLHGMCYHFALILHNRFQDEGAHKLYDPINHHFAVEINGRIYDITGDITENTIYEWVMWQSIYFHDVNITNQVMEQCIWKVPKGVILCAFCRHSFDDDWGNKICDIDNHPVEAMDDCDKFAKRA